VCTKIKTQKNLVLFGYVIKFSILRVIVIIFFFCWCWGGGGGGGGLVVWRGSRDRPFSHKGPHTL